MSKKNTSKQVNPEEILDKEVLKEESNDAQESSNIVVKKKTHTASPKKQTCERKIIFIHNGFAYCEDPDKHTSVISAKPGMKIGDIIND